MDWANELNSIINSTNTQSFVGTCVGNVISSSPLEIEIMNGNIKLHNGNFYISEHLTDHELSVDIDVTTESTDVSTHGSHSHGVHVVGDMKIDNGLKVGDTVLVCSTEDNQTYFVVDRLVRP